MSKKFYVVWPVIGADDAPLAVPTPGGVPLQPSGLIVEHSSYWVQRERHGEVTTSLPGTLEEAREAHAAHLAPGEPEADEPTPTPETETTPRSTSKRKD